MYSRVSSKRVGWNKRAGWKISPFGNLGDQKVFEIHMSNFWWPKKSYFHQMAMEQNLKFLDNSLESNVAFWKFSKKE